MIFNIENIKRYIEDDSNTQLKICRKGQKLSSVISMNLDQCCACWNL